MTDNAPLAAEIAKQKNLVRLRQYYDKNREKILERQMALYYARRDERIASGQEVPKQKRGRKPKPREVVITLGPNGDVRVG